MGLFGLILFGKLLRRLTAWLGTPFVLWTVAHTHRYALAPIPEGEGAPEVRRRVRDYFHRFWVLPGGMSVYQSRFLIPNIESWILHPESLYNAA